MHGRPIALPGVLFLHWVRTTPSSHTRLAHSPACRLVQADPNVYSPNALQATWAPVAPAQIVTLNDVADRKLHPAPYLADAHSDFQGKLCPLNRLIFAHERCRLMGQS